MAAAAPATTATAPYSTLSTKHNLSLSTTHHINTNSLGFLSQTSVRVRPLSISSSRPAKLPMKVQATSAATPVTKPSELNSSAAPTVVDVDLGDRSYPIYIGSGLLNQPDLLQRY